MNIPCLYAAAFFLQPAVDNLAACKGMGPDLVLCLTVLLIALKRDPRAAIVASTAAALLQDICYALYAGPGAAAMLAASLCAALAFRLCAWEGLWLVLALAVLGTLVCQVALWAGNWLFGAPWLLVHMLARLPLQVFCNGAVCAAAYAAFTKERKETRAK